MGDVKGFMKYERRDPSYRNANERIGDWKEIPQPLDKEALEQQGARCMDCGIPFCHSGCPLGNIIPDFNDLVYRDHWEAAIARLHATNNFPEFTGRICPAPCETACVLGINEPAVTIKQIECAIIDRAWEEGWVIPQRPEKRTEKTVAVIGSGPAGLAAAQQLNRAGHTVTVFEKDSRPGGLMMYGIPHFKMEKQLIHRRVEQMEAEGIEFKCSVDVGSEAYPVEKLTKDFDAVLLAIGSREPRNLPVPGRELKGVYYAMEFLTQANKAQEGDTIEDQILAKDKHVIVIGGGDTGSDCIGTSIRQGAKSVTQVELMPKPIDTRPVHQPWPYYPMSMRTSTSQAEMEILPEHNPDGDRQWSILTKKFTGDDEGNVKEIHGVRLNWETADGGRPAMREVEGSEWTWPADLVLLAMGFVHPEKPGLIEGLEAMGMELDERNNVKADGSYRTALPNVFAAGDARRGQSLVVYALAEGREAARTIDEYLMGKSDLPSLRTRELSLPRR